MILSPLRYFPADVALETVARCLGLVSDTHMPERCAHLPSALFTALEGVDLVLHAGDVGELWVFDRLSAIAPVVAVYGNDDTDDAQRELPYRQTIAIDGRRLLLCHEHYPDRARELASRRDNAWGPKLDRPTALARSAGATTVVPRQTQSCSHRDMVHLITSPERTIEICRPPTTTLLTTEATRRSGPRGRRDRRRWRGRP